MDAVLAAPKDPRCRLGCPTQPAEGASVLLRVKNLGRELAEQPARILFSPAATIPWFGCEERTVER